MENLAYLLLLLLVLIMLLIYVGYDIWCMSRFTYSPKKDKDQPSMWDPPSPIRRILDNWFDAILTKKLLKRLESQLEKRQEHEFVMKKLELESRYHVDSLEEVKWRKSYYELLKQCHDSE